MTSRELRTDDLVRERAHIVRSGRLHWFHWAVVALSLMATIAAWHFSKTQVEARSAEHYNRYAKQFIELVNERMQKYEEGLWGGVSAIQANGGEMLYEEWKVFAESLRIDLRYPGINGVGVIYFVTPDKLKPYLAKQRKTRPGFNIHPPHEEKIFLPITYIEPLATNAAAVGLDMAHETNRYQAALKARDMGSAQITGPIVLVQDANKTAGFLFYAPFYHGLTHDTVEARRDQFLGMVYAPFVFYKLIEGTLDAEKRQIRVKVSDGGEVLYDEGWKTDPEYDPNPMYSSKIALNLYGRTWEFDLWTTQSFRNTHTATQPIIILIGGFCIDALLLSLFLFLTRANRRAIRVVESATAELERRAEALQQSNEELESFAYVASHDLKAPLRGISNLATWIEQDIGDFASDDVRGYTKLLHGRIHRMENLLTDLLQYSRAGSNNSAPEPVDMETDLPEIFKLMAPPESIRLELAGRLPTLNTVRAPLEQVLRNLIGNAIKHSDAQTSVIIIGCREVGAMYEFSVFDDGPGIPPEYHEKVFKIFQTLKTRDEVEASDIGLAIIKRIVASTGGRIALHSDPTHGRGTTFTFTWPKEWHRNNEVDQAA